MDNPTFPPVPKALVNALNAVFPDKCPSLRTSDRDIWAAVGARQVVDFLAEQHQQQNEEGNVLQQT